MERRGAGHLVSARPSAQAQSAEPRPFGRERRQAQRLRRNPALGVLLQQSVENEYRTSLRSWQENVSGRFCNGRPQTRSTFSASYKKLLTLLTQIRPGRARAAARAPPPSLAHSAILD